MCNLGIGRLFAVLTGLVVLAANPVTAVQAASADEIDAKVVTALAQFRKEVKGADGYLQEAKALLVIPDVKKVGFVVAAQWGTGALQVGGRTVAYYKMDAGSAGFQAGYQSANFVFVFFTQGAVETFRQSRGWTVGAETGLTFVEASAGVGVDTLKGQGDVAAFSFGREGLMAGWSAKGTKFTPVTPE